jgi:phosphatidylserine/phosphatidylglycerophosphate/cardiolipin synthase-like enzyme
LAKKEKAMRRILWAIVLFFNFTLPLQCKQVALFSPEDKITSHLISHIKTAKSHIYAAVYFITDKKIADALIDAKKQRNLDVQIVTDQVSIIDTFGKGQYLRQNGIDLFIYKPQSNQKKRPPLMHNKFAIIDNKIWTGSFNWTVSANRRNQENVLLSDDPNLLERYIKQFEILKKRCIYHPTITHHTIIHRKRPWYRGISHSMEGFVRTVRKKLSHKKEVSVQNKKNPSRKS